MSADDGIDPSPNGPAPQPAAELLPVVYEELRALARYRMANEAAGHTLNATALVHEAWLRLNKDGAEKLWNDKTHFFRTASEAMRRILIDRARAKKRHKRGGDLDRTDLFESQLTIALEDDEILLVNEALDELARVDPEGAELVKMHFFTGLTWEEIADITGDSTRTLRRKWAYARSWLQLEIAKLK